MKHQQATNHRPSGGVYRYPRLHISQQDMSKQEAIPSARNGLNYAYVSRWLYELVHFQILDSTVMLRTED